MYVVKSAFRSIARAKGRNILIGIIALVIAVASCVALSIRQAAITAKNDALTGMSITGTVSYDRTSAMNAFSGSVSDDGTFDRSQMMNMMNGTTLTLDDYLSYTSYLGENDGYYYSQTSGLNATGDLLPYGDDGVDGDDESDAPPESNENDNFGGRGQMPFSMAESGDFLLVGYSSDEAMTQFGTSGTYSITQGQVFEKNTASLDCIISDELAVWNNLSLDDTITLSNPNDETQTWTFNIVGIYTNSASGETSFGRIMTDPANYIYLSSAALSTVITESEANEETAMSGTVSFTYAFPDTESYYNFESAVASVLPEGYMLSSSELSSYEASLLPLENLSTTAQWFLLVIFIVGAIILVVLNIFNIRDRKYEVGVLTAIGMKKSKVAAQFVCELFTVMLCAIIIGAGIGAVASVPVSNALLENQVQSVQDSSQTVTDNFGREQSSMGGMGSFGDRGNIGSFGNMSGNFTPVDYISSISYSTDLIVIAELIGVGILLIFISSLAAIMFIMRYEPLKILSNRD